MVIQINANDPTLWLFPIWLLKYLLLQTSEQKQNLSNRISPRANSFQTNNFRREREKNKIFVDKRTQKDAPAPLDCVVMDTFQ